MPVPVYSGPNVSTGNGVTTVFPYNFLIFDESHIAVTVDGVTKTLNTHYTVSGVGVEAGGNITMLTAPAHGEQVVRDRVVPYERTDYDYQEGGSFQAATVDADIDTATMQIQQVAAAVKRALKAPRSVSTDQVFSEDDWAASAGKFVRRNVAGDGWEFVAATPDEGTFTQSGAGSVARSFTAKVGEMATSPADKGAEGDGITDDTTALTALHDATNDHDPVYVPDATFLTTTGLIALRNKVEGCAGAIYKCTDDNASYDFLIAGDRAIVRDLKLVGEGVQTLAHGANTEHTLLDNIYVENNKAAAPGQNAVRLANTVPVDYKLVNSVIDATGFAFTLDSAADGGHGLILANNYITSDDADAIELNMPNATFTDAAVVGNILGNLGSGSTGGRGFSVGVAGLQNVAVVGNASFESRNEAFHIEDAVRTVAIVGNVAKECYNDGVEFIPDPAGESRALVVVGNSLEQRAGVSGKYGIAFFTSSANTLPAISSITRSGSVATVTFASAHGLYNRQSVVFSGATQTEYNLQTLVRVTGLTTVTYTVNGAPASPATGSPLATASNSQPPPSLMVGNAVRDFDYAFSAATGLSLMDANLCEEATSGVVNAGSSHVIGENVASFQEGGVPATLVSMDQVGGICGKIYANAIPTAYITKTAGLMPGVLRGFFHPLTDYVHAGGTTDDVPIVTLPDLARGRIIVRARSGSSTFMYCSANIFWDGTTLTVSEEMRKNVGSIGGNLGGFTVSGGVLRLKMFIAAAAVFIGDVDFTGEWVKY